MDNNHEATTIYRAMRFMARGNGGNIHSRQTVTWCDITCVYYPMSNSYNWFGAERPSFALCKDQVISMINRQLAYAAEQRMVA